jgi:hypothetical protein
LEIALKKKVFRKEVEEGIKRLVVGKAKDIEGLHVEHLKWGHEYISHQLTTILNLMLSKGLLSRWTRSLIILIFKEGEKNNLGNYKTIMISLVFAKLMGGVVERKLSKWLEDVGKRA